MPSLARTRLDFANQLLSCSSDTTTLALSTLSLHDALPISFAASGDFAATSTGASACPMSPATLAAGGNCTINVTFTPAASGARTGTLSVADNAGVGPQTVPLSGNGDRKSVV